MADEITIHAARRHDEECWEGGGWYYVQLDDGWYGLSRYADGGQPGGTRPVRVATTDRGEPPKCACHDCHELLPDDWTHGAYCGQCINRCEPAKPTPSGLSAEQEIRARAAELYWNGSPGTWTLTDIVAWIRDGKEPSDV